MFLAFSFGVPVIATDVGSLREDINDENGLLCRPMDPVDLARAITAFFDGELYAQKELRRSRIRDIAVEDHSWTKVADSTAAVYTSLLHSR